MQRLECHEIFKYFIHVLLVINLSLYDTQFGQKIAILIAETHAQETCTEQNAALFGTSFWYQKLSNTADQANRTILDCHVHRYKQKSLSLSIKIRPLVDTVHYKGFIYLFIFGAGFLSMCHRCYSSNCRYISQQKYSLTTSDVVILRPDCNIFTQHNFPRGEGNF